MIAQRARTSQETAPDSSWRASQLREGRARLRAFRTDECLILEQIDGQVQNSRADDRCSRPFANQLSKASFVEPSMRVIFDHRDKEGLFGQKETRHGCRRQAGWRCRIAFDQRVEGRPDRPKGLADATQND